MSGETFAYLISIDLGQSSDYTAVSVIEEQLWNGAGWISPERMMRSNYDIIMQQIERYGRPPNPPLEVRHLYRYPLGTRYTAIAEEIRDMVMGPPLNQLPCVLLIDKTGVGSGVIDNFLQLGVNPIGIQIHGGANLNLDTRMGYRVYNVPKRDLVGAAQVLLQNKRLKIAAALSEAETLKNELLNFRMKIDPKTSHDSYSHWREGDHDDLLLATAQAVWLREWWMARMETYYAATWGSLGLGGEAV